MATVVNQFTPTPSTANSTTYTSDSFTPTADALLVVFVHSTQAVSGSLTASANGLTFTWVGQQAYKNSGNDRILVYIANQLTSSSPASMTLTHSQGQSSTGCVISVAAVTGMTITGTSAMRRLATANEVSSGAAPSTVFSAAALTGNPTLFAWLTSVSSDATPPSGWTEQVDVSYLTPTTGAGYASRDSGFTGTTITLGSTANGLCCALALEMDTSVPTPATVTMSGAVARPTSSFAMWTPASISMTGSLPTLTSNFAVNHPISYSAEVLADAPYLYWRLGDSAGTTATDASGNARHGTYAGSPTLGVTGLLANSVDTAVTFDGVDDRVTYADTSSLTQFTVECWVTRSGAPAATESLMRRASDTTDGGGTTFVVGINTLGQAFFTTRASGFVRVLDSPLNIADGARHHIAATRNSAGLMVLYVDGAPTNSGTRSGTLLGSSNPFVAGSFDGSTQTLTGTLDEVAYYHTALPESRIVQHYQAGADSPVIMLSTAASTSIGNASMTISTNGTREIVPGDVFVVVLQVLTHPHAFPTTASIQTFGTATWGTWTRVTGANIDDVRREEVWISAATSSGTLTHGQANWTGVSSSVVTGFAAALLRGVSTTQAVTAAYTASTVAGTSYTSPSVTAGPGQFVMLVESLTADTSTFPVNPNPVVGWRTTRLINNGRTALSGMRIPQGTAAHTLDTTISGNGAHFSRTALVLGDAIVSSANLTLAGELPALIGDFALLSSLTASLAGELPSLTGELFLAGPAPAVATLAGALPALTAELALTIIPPANTTLSGSLPALSGAFTIVAHRALSMTATMPTLTASFTVIADPAITLDGALPAVSGSFALANPRSMALAGELPALVGGFVMVGSASVSFASDLPVIEATFVIVGVTATDRANRAGGRTRVGLAHVEWEPAVVEPPASAVPALAYDVAVAFGTITRRRAQPSYSVTTATSLRARQRLVVGGRDVTYFRDVVTPPVSYQLIAPLLYGPATLMFPQIVAHVETPGVGALRWLRKGGTVKVQRVNDAGEVVATDYRGVIIAFNLDGGSLTVEVGGQASGRAALMNKQLPLVRAVRDIGRLAHDGIRQLGLQFKPHLGPQTGIELARFGGMSQLDYLSELCAKAWTRDGAQWSIMPDAENVYRLQRKDTTTVHATVYLDDARTVGSLRRDIAEEPNRVYMTGVDPEGRRLRNAVFPGLVQAPPAPYPMSDNSSFDEGTTNDDTDTGDGISVMVQRLRVMKYLDREDTPGGYDSDTVRAIKALQDDAGLNETGVMNPATWRALFDLDATGYSLRSAHIEPMAQRSKVRKWNRTSSGAKKARNPNYDPTVLPVDINVDAGVGFTHDQLREWARAELSTEDNWVGTIALNTGAVIAGEHTPGDALTSADVMSARALRPGMNVWAPQFMGGTLFHVSGIAVSDGAVSLSVDTRARDTMKVWEIIQRNRETRHDPARAWISQHRSSTMSNDAVGEWDTAGGVIDDVPCDGGAWTVFPVPAGQEGTIRSIRIRTENSAAEYVVAIFGRRVTRKWLTARVPAPLTPPTTYTDTIDGEEVEVTRHDNSARWEAESVRKRLDNRFLLYAAGTDEQPCGYFPGRKTSDNGKRTNDRLTGRHEDDAGVSYHTFAEPVVYVAIFPDRDCVVRGGRIMWNQLEAGS